MLNKLWAQASPVELDFYVGLTRLAAPAAFAAMLRELFCSDWVVYAKRRFRDRHPASHLRPPKAFSDAPGSLQIPPALLAAGIQNG